MIRLTLLASSSFLLSIIGMYVNEYQYHVTSRSEMCTTPWKAIARLPRFHSVRSKFLTHKQHDSDKKTDRSDMVKQSVDSRVSINLEIEELHDPCPGKNSRQMKMLSPPK